MTQINLTAEHAASAAGTDKPPARVEGRLLLLKPSRHEKPICIIRWCWTPWAVAWWSSQ